MGTAADHEKRSQEIADTARRVVVTLNGGGIGVIFSVAGALAKNVNPNWAVWPVSFFVFGLLLTGLSLLLAKHRELKRRDAAEEGKDEPKKFTAWYLQSFTWDLVAFVLFGIGALVGLFTLSSATGGA